MTALQEQKAWLRQQPEFVKFSNAWFWKSTQAATRRLLLEHKPSSLLEIGCYEGQATRWFATELTSLKELVAVDPLGQGSIENVLRDEAPESGLLEAFLRNTAGAPVTVELLQGYSTDKLPGLIESGREFDCVYVDGSHDGKDVLTDAILADLLLAPGGLLVFDDYRWTLNRHLPELAGTHAPKPAIDAFVKLFVDCSNARYELLHKGYQVALRKLV